MTLAPGIRMPNAVKVAISVLAPLELPAGPRIPKPRPDRFLVVRRLGGDEATPVSDKALITVEGWALDDEQAEDLCQQARTLLHSARGQTHAGAVIYRVTGAGGPAPLPDPDGSSHRRYVTQLELHVRGGN